MPWPDEPDSDITDPPDLDPYIAWDKLFSVLSAVGDDVWICRCAPGFESWAKIQTALYACAPMPPPEGYARITGLANIPVEGCGKSARWALLGDFDASAVFAAEPAVMKQFLDTMGGVENIKCRFAYSAVCNGWERTYPDHCTRFGWAPLDLEPFEKIAGEVHPPLD